MAAATAAVSVAAAGLFAVHSPSAAAQTVNVPRSGVFTGLVSGPSVDTFANWRGRSVGKVNSFLGGGTWSDIEAPDWFLGNWGNSAYASSQVVTAPMLPSDTSTTMVSGANGAYDSHWVTLAKRLVGAGLGSSTMRIGWELNGNWYRWSAVNDPASYAGYYRHIVNAMRSVAGQHFTFNWNVSNNTWWDPSPAWPGDGYVDYVGVDFYDLLWGNSTASPATRWASEISDSYGLNYWASFATQHNKPMGIDEWGLTNPNASMANGGGGGDNPYFVDSAHAWFGTHNVAYECYFDVDAGDGRHAISNSNTSFPQAAAEYRRLFNAPAVTTTTAPAPAPTTTPVTAPAPVSTTTAPAPVTTRPTTAPSPAPTYLGPAISLHLSKTADRRTSVDLKDATAAGNIYVFVTSSTPNISSVGFWIDDSTRLRPAFHNEVVAPFDLAGGSVTAAGAYNSARLTNGAHTMTVLTTFASGQRTTQTVSFTVKNPSVTLGSAVRINR